MPTYELVGALLLLVGLWYVTRRWPVPGAILATVLVVASLALTFGAKLYFGGPVILAGTVIGFAWGWLSGRREAR